MVSEASSGYCLNVKINKGKEAEKTSILKTSLEMLSPFYSENHLFYADRFYTFLCRCDNIKHFYSVQKL
jgi:hypothetical protein